MRIAWPSHYSDDCSERYTPIGSEIKQHELQILTVKVNKLLKGGMVGKLLSGGEKAAG